MDYDRDELLAAMYNSDEPEKQTTKEPDEGIGFSRTRKIKVGIIEYEVPTVEYVNRLELMVMQQARVIETQRRQMERIKGSIMTTRNFIRRQTGRIADMQMELEGKVDYREYS